MGVFLDGVPCSHAENFFFRSGNYQGAINVAGKFAAIYRFSLLEFSVEKFWHECRCNINVGITGRKEILNRLLYRIAGTMVRYSVNFCLNCLIIAIFEASDEDEML